MSSIITYIQSFITNILTALGLTHKKGTILFLGLDNAGKTTLLHKLKTNSLFNAFPPTNRAHLESFSFGGIQFAGWDLGGHEAVRHLWEDYVCEASAIMFLVDAADWARLEEVRDELDALIGDQVLRNGNEHGHVNRNIPLAIMLNKCDLVEAQGSEDIANAIGYSDIVQQYYRLQNEYENGEEADNNIHEEEERVKMFRMSVYRGQGYQEAFRWIASFL
jgi:GTP-binding protein SAR1